MNLLITGISGRLGQEVVRQLIHENPFDHVVGIDHSPPSTLGPVTQFLPGDLRSMPIGDLIVLNEIQCVLHLAGDRRDGVRTEAQIAERLLEVAALVDLDRVVIPSRDWVYAPQVTPCDENAPLRPFNRLRARLGWGPIESKLLLERAIANAMNRTPEVSVVIPRMCTVIGPSCDQPMERVLGSRWLFGLRNQEARLQFLDIEDAARILIQLCLEPDLSGPYNVASEGVLSLSSVAGVLEKPLIQLPNALLRFTVSGLARMGLISCGFGDVVRIHSGVPMKTQRLVQKLGRPRLTSRQALALWRVNG